ncbi:hypothetical protein [Gynuella sp.]|uniref:hypothetical protein n=1 Tax=Gynuella sp. TaxID=2969146 RepID=UPI003D13FEFB
MHLMAQTIHEFADLSKRRGHYIEDEQIKKSGFTDNACSMTKMITSDKSRGPLKNRNSFDAGEEAPLATPKFTGVNEDVRLGLTTSGAKTGHVSEVP